MLRSKVVAGGEELRVCGPCRFVIALRSPCSSSPGFCDSNRTTEGSLPNTILKDLGDFFCNVQTETYLWEYHTSCAH